MRTRAFIHLAAASVAAAGVFSFSVQVGHGSSVAEAAVGSGEVVSSVATTTPSGVSFRASDPSYAGPGVRFVSLDEAASGNLARSRTTIVPMSDHRAMQLFEDSPDGGKTWHVVFKAEDRPLGPGES